MVNAGKWLGLALYIIGMFMAVVFAKPATVVVAIGCGLAGLGAFIFGYVMAKNAGHNTL